MRKKRKRSGSAIGKVDYGKLLSSVSGLLEEARRVAARSVNAVLTATYWEVGRRVVEFEQGGARRAEYGARLLQHLAGDLTARFGRGFSRQNLQQMRYFYLSYPPEKICQTVSGKFKKAQTVSGKSGRTSGISTKSGVASRRFNFENLAAMFPLP